MADTKRASESANKSRSRHDTTHCIINCKKKKKKNVLYSWVHGSAVDATGVVSGEVEAE